MNYEAGMNNLGRAIGTIDRRGDLVWPVGELARIERSGPALTGGPGEVEWGS
jgi:hypothetical protein